MSLISVFFIGIGLSMDAFAVSIAKGMTMKKHEVLRYACLLYTSKYSRTRIVS